MPSISEYSIFENEVVLGSRVRLARWNNDAIAQAEFYAGLRKMKESTGEKLLRSACAGKIQAVRALLYGALKAKNSRYTIAKFEQEFQHRRLPEYLVAVAEGAAMYLPSPSVAETEKEATTTIDAAGEHFLNDFAAIGVRALRMSRQQIADSSPRCIYRMMLDLTDSEDVEKTGTIYADEIPWL